MDMTLGDRIKTLREKKGMTQLELAEKLGYKSKSSVAHIENGRDIPRAMVVTLAEILETTPAYLMGWEDDKPNAEILSTGENIYKIPVFSSVSAGFGAYACSDVIDYMHLYIANPADVPEMLCIKVTGDSMYPKIEDGDIIVVRKQDSVDSGSIAVVLVDGEEGFVKKVIYDNETIELVSINPEYAPKIFKGAEVLRVRVVGIVKQVIKTL
jgi:repressor LexA